VGNLSFITVKRFERKPKGRELKNKVSHGRRAGQAYWREGAARQRRRERKRAKLGGS